MFVSTIQARRDAAWARGFDHLCAFTAEHRAVNVPARYVASDGFRLGQWFWVQTAAMRQGVLSPDRVATLKAAGVDPRNRREVWSDRVRAVVEAKRDGRVPDPDILRSLRGAHRHGRLTGEQIRELDAAAMSWSAHRSVWNQHVDEARAYAKDRGELPPRRHHGRSGAIGEWLYQSLRRLRSGELTPERAQDLASLVALTVPGADG